MQAAAPGLRPPLFYSPYEAAIWAVLSARRPAAQTDRVRSDLAAAHGRVFELAGQRLAALALAGQLYGLPGAASAEDLQRISQRWRPWRTWCTVLLRAAAGRLLPVGLS